MFGAESSWVMFGPEGSWSGLVQEADTLNW